MARNYRAIADMIRKWTLKTDTTANYSRLHAKGTAFQQAHFQIQTGILLGTLLSSLIF